MRGFREETESRGERKRERKNEPSVLIFRSESVAAGHQVDVLNTLCLSPKDKLMTASATKAHWKQLANK